MQPAIRSATRSPLVFGHDGHGSTRVLTDLVAAVVQLFVYDAYGQLLAIMNGSGGLVSGGINGLADSSLAQTSLLYSGEQFDSRIGQAVVAQCRRQSRSQSERRVDRKNNGQRPGPKPPLSI